MTTETATNPIVEWLRRIRPGLTLLAVFFGLCTIFAGVVTAANAIQERTEAGWPKATATVDSIDMVKTSSGARQYYIRCRLKFIADTQQIVTKIYSRNVPPAEVSQYPPNQIGPFIDWVNAHPPGTQILVRYDPAQPTKAVLAEDYMPMGGPQTPNNIKLTEFVTAGFLFLMIVVRATGQRSREETDDTSLSLDS